MNRFFYNFDYTYFILYCEKQLNLKSIGCKNNIKLNFDLNPTKKNKEIF